MESFGGGYWSNARAVCFIKVMLEHAPVVNLFKSILCVVLARASASQIEDWRLKIPRKYFMESSNPCLGLPPFLAEGSTRINQPLLGFDRGSHSRQILYCLEQHPVYLFARLRHQLIEWAPRLIDILDDWRVLASLESPTMSVALSTTWAGLPQSRGTPTYGFDILSELPPKRYPKKNMHT